MRLNLRFSTSKGEYFPGFIRLYSHFEYEFLVLIWLKLETKKISAKVRLFSHSIAHQIVFQAIKWVSTMQQSFSEDLQGLRRDNKTTRPDKRHNTLDNYLPASVCAFQTNSRTHGRTKFYIESRLINIQVHSDNDASEVDIQGHSRTFWDILGHFETIRKTL